MKTIVLPILFLSLVAFADPPTLVESAMIEYGFSEWPLTESTNLVSETWEPSLQWTLDSGAVVETNREDGLLAHIDSFAIDPLMAQSEEFIRQLGLQTSGTNLPPVHWTMPTNAFEYGEWSGRFLEVSGRNDYRIELTNSMGTSSAYVEFEEYPSDAEALVCIGFLAGGSGSDTFEDLVAATTVRTNHVGVVELSNTHSVATQGRIWKWCRYRSVGFECQVSANIDVLNLATHILRAGGVDIPAEPESPEPNPE